MSQTPSLKSASSILKEDPNFSSIFKVRTGTQCLTPKVLARTDQEATPSLRILIHDKEKQSAISKKFWSPTATSAKNIDISETDSKSRSNNSNTQTDPQVSQEKSESKSKRISIFKNIGESSLSSFKPHRDGTLSDSALKSTLSSPALTDHLRKLENSSSTVETPTNQHETIKPSSFKKAVKAADLDESKSGEFISSGQYKYYVFSPSVPKEIIIKHLSLSQKGLNYALNFLKGPSESYLSSRKISLQNLSDPNKKSLILDLDETLIWSCTIHDNPDAYINYEQDGKQCKLTFKIRPYAQEFLKNMKKYFEIILFTAATTLYAEAVLKELDPKRNLISYVLDRGHCLTTKNGFFIKDLRIISNRDLKNMVIVDNLVHSFGLQLDNGVPIIEWTGEINDSELKYIQDYLIELYRCDDIPEYNRKKLRLRDLSKLNIDNLNINI